jgi:signal transduction histidine kinase
VTSRSQALLDWSLAAAVAAGAILQQQDCGCQRDPFWLNAAVLLLVTLPLGFRRRWPFAVLSITGTASVLHVLLGFTNQFMGTFAVLIAMFSVAYYASWTFSVLGAAAVALALPVNFAVDWHNHGHAELNDIPYNYALFGAAWILGDNLRQRRQRERELEDRAERLQAEQEERALRAVADERVRIARDLHDAVAHTLSVIVLQAGAARRLAAQQPQRAASVLGSIEAQGREAVADMRRLVGILRAQGDGAAETEPQPSLGQLDTLVERVRAAGLDVRVRTEGESKPLPGGADLSAYRIVQEALTNTLRHAAASRAEVVLRYGPAGLEIEVCDDGRGPGAGAGGVGAAGGAGAAGPAAEAGASATAGHGLLGMRERVGLFGGELEAGPRSGGGFRVRAVLPVDE